MPQVNPSSGTPVSQSLDTPQAVERPLNPVALRRSWAEPSVRSWWLTALVLAVLIVCLMIEQFINTHELSYRISHWTPVSARIDQIGDSTRVSLRVLPDILAGEDVHLSYRDAAGVSHTVIGRLTGQTEPRHPSDMIPVLIDPAEPTHWTDRTVMPSLAERMMIPLGLSPIPVLMGLASIWQRSRLLKLWQTGVQREANVVHVQQSAVSPRSSMIRCALANMHGNRLLRVSVPHRRAMLSPGDTIQLITPATGNSALAIAAMLYQ